MRANDDKSSLERPTAKEPRTPAGGPVSGVAELHRSVGNAAVARLIAQRRVAPRRNDGEEQPTAHEVLKTSGMPLDTALRREMETRLGHDFSDVRLHADAKAQRSAVELGAHAYTSGNHIVSATAGIDKHTLAHELTHVVQQRQGPVAGTDRGNGLKVSDPSDRYEREAEATAARVMSHGHTETRAPSEPTTPATGAIQRWAFVGGQQTEPGAEGLTPEMNQLAADDLVHDYETKAEFAAHAAGNTDYLGNLTEGTWVRFSPEGINVLGEQHNAITLAEVLRAVGSASFIYESFVIESLDREPNTKAAYRERQRGRLEQFGQARDADWTAHGAESLYPKLGYSMALLLPYLRRPETLEGLGQAGTHAYLGQQLQGFLKIGWQYGKDMRDQSDPEPERANLVDVYKQVKNPKKVANLFGALGTSVNEFVKALPDGGYLGDAFTSEEARAQHAGPLAAYVKALVDELRERGGHDAVAPARPGRATLADKEADFASRRNQHLRNAVREALTQGVRYAGMGREHYSYLLRVNADESWHFYDLTGQHLRQFRDLTRQRADQATEGS
jgi:hypothetical protein